MSGRRLARGIFDHRGGREVRWRDGGQTRTKWFPADAPLDALTAYRDTKERIRSRQPKDTGSFPRDVVKFLRPRKGLASYRADCSHLRCWVSKFKKLSRFAITREQIAAVIADWRPRYSPRELRHRLRLLKQVFTHYDPDRANPCEGVRLPTPAKSRPRSVADTIIAAVAERLRAQELAGRLRTAKTRARYLVLATCGQRPAQVKRAKPADVDLERRLWFVEPAKGDNGTVVYLNEEMLAAWHVFIAADAWGSYDTVSFVKTLRRNGWPAGIGPYNLRHSVGLSLSERGVELGDIQAHMGHTSPATTRAFYVPGVLARLREASVKLDRRLVLHAGATSAEEGKANPLRNTPVFATEPAPRKTPIRRRRLRKTA